MTPPLTPQPPTPDDVRRVLAGVLDPELHASIVDLGMVHDVRIEANGDVVVKVALDDRGLPVARADRERRALQGRADYPASRKSASSTAR